MEKQVGALPFVKRLDKLVAGSADIPDDLLFGTLGWFGVPVRVSGRGDTHADLLTASTQSADADGGDSDCPAALHVSLLPISRAKQASQWAMREGHVL